MYITRDRHASTVRLVPSYVSDGHYKAAQAMKQKINQLEDQCSHHAMQLAAVLCSSLCFGFLGGMLAYRWMVTP